LFAVELTRVMLFSSFKNRN